MQHRWNRVRLLGALGAIAMAAACSGLPAVGPTVELVDIAVLGASGDKQRFALTLLVSNANAEAVSIEAIEYSVRLGGQGYLNGRAPMPTTLEPSSQRTVRVELETDTASSPSAWPVEGPDNAINYELIGDLVLPGRPPRLSPFVYAGAAPVSLPTRR